MSDWPPRSAPRPLRRAHLRALAELLAHAEASIAAAARYDYVEATSAGRRAAFAGLRCAFLAPLVDVLGGHPPRHRYASKALRTEAKRWRTGHSERKRRWEGRAT